MIFKFNIKTHYNPVITTYFNYICSTIFLLNFILDHNYDILHNYQVSTYSII